MSKTTVYHPELQLYRVSRRNDQTVFIWLLPCPLDQILTCQLYDLYLILGYCHPQKGVFTVTENKVQVAGKISQLTTKKQM
jgi:hypothetical protein